MNSRTPSNVDVFSLAWPIGMNAILQQTVLLIDTVLVGGLGEESLAAMGIATSIAGLIIGVLFALSNGTQILVAQAFGADDKTALKSGFWSGLIVGLVVVTVGITCIVLFRDTLINRLADDASIARMASDYLLVSTMFLAGMAVSENISVFLYATDRPKIPFYSKVVELPTNALVSYALIYGVWGMPELGVVGAAIGSAVTVIGRCLYLCWYLFYKKLHYLLEPGWIRNSLQNAVFVHLKNASPIAATFISMNFSMAICMMVYSQLEVSEFAAFTALFIWIRASGMIGTAWSQSIGIWVGRLLGQDRSHLLDSFVKNAWKVALVISLLIAGIYALTPALFAVLYPNFDDNTLDVVRTVLPALILMPFIRTSNTVCGNVLRAAGQARYAFTVHVTAQWLFTVPMTILFVLVLDLSVLWVFSIILFEEILKSVPFHHRIAQGSWKSESAKVI